MIFHQEWYVWLGVLAVLVIVIHNVHYTSRDHISENPGRIADIFKDWR